MKKEFETTYNDHHIKIVNTWFSGEKLYIDGQLQDENLGLALRATLKGKIQSNENKWKEIKVTLGGFFTIDCKLFVDREYVQVHRV